MLTVSAGHELHTLLTNPDNEGQWRGLIERVRNVYKGKVSVAFNGNPFFNDVSDGGVPWLDALDFIGLDCYWPVYTDLTKLEHWWDVASVEDIVAGWQPTVAKMANVVSAAAPFAIPPKVSRRKLWCVEQAERQDDHVHGSRLPEPQLRLDPRSQRPGARPAGLLLHRQLRQPTRAGTSVRGADPRAVPDGLVRRRVPMAVADGPDSGRQLGRQLHAAAEARHRGDEGALHLSGPRAGGANK